MRRGRLDWPDGATSRDSLKAVLKLPRLQVRQVLDLMKFFLRTFTLICVADNVHVCACVVAESDNATCGPFGGRVDKHGARAT